MSTGPLRPRGRGPACSRAPTAWQSRFVGRAADLAALEELADRPDIRWITLVGPPGVGKTRLLEALDDRLATLPAHVIWADAAAGRYLERVAQTLDVKGPVRSLEEAVADAIGPAPTFLVLDDASDQALGGADEVFALLAHNPRLKVLAASSEPLGLPGETTVRVDGLDPDAAAHLFIDRALRVRPDLVLDEQTRSDVEQLCTVLHGVPFDVELAAARVGTVGVSGLASAIRTTEHTTAHTTGHTTAHRAVTGIDAFSSSSPSAGPAVTLSYECLSEDGRRLLRALSVLHGPFTIEQAHDLHPAEESPLIDALTELVDAWLLEPVDGADDELRRFVLPPVVRVFAADLARACGEQDRLRALHADHHAGRARDWALRVDDAGEARGLLAMTRLLPELEAVVDWYTERHDLPHALRVAADLAPISLRQGSASAVARRLDDLLSDPAADRADPHTRGDALVWLAQARLQSVEGEEAVPGIMARWSEGLRVLRGTGDERAILRTLAIGALALPATQDVQLTRTLLDEGLELADRLDHAVWRARFEVWCGMLAHQLRDDEEAWRLGVASLARARAAGDPHGEIAAALLLVPLRGEFDGLPSGLIPTAHDLLELAESVHDAALTSLAMAFVAEEALDAGDAARAAQWIGARLSGIRDFESWRVRGYSIMLTARTALLVGEYAQAATLHGALQRVLPTLLAGCPPRYADRYIAAMEGLRRELGDAEFDRLVHEGSLTSWPDAISMAAASAARLGAVAAPPPRSAAGEEDVGPSGLDALSAPQREVLQLMTRGLTHGEIAARLDVPASTVLRHSATIYRTLHVRGRAEAVARASREAG